MWHIHNGRLLDQGEPFFFMLLVFSAKLVFKSGNSFFFLSGNGCLLNFHSSHNTCSHFLLLLDLSGSATFLVGKKCVCCFLVCDSMVLGLFSHDTMVLLRLQTIKAIINSSKFKGSSSDEPRRVQVLDLYCLTRFESESSGREDVY